MESAYNIIEVANVHDGNFDYLLGLINDFSAYKDRFGIKFQPFKYDEIALPDFSWYPVYEELYFSPDQWRQAIEKASTTKDVWIDCFDSYTVQIVSENLAKIKGLKFQASVLYNHCLIEKFSQLNLTDKTIILNVSGYDIDGIKNAILSFSTLLKPKEIILQIGFQSYPTEMIDSGLSKISTLKSNFEHRLSFADHVEPTAEDSYMLPLIAFTHGCDIIEKHVRRAGGAPKYDFYSSMDPDQFQKFVSFQTAYTNAFHQPFINKKEEKYLATSIQIPVLNKAISKGKLLNIKEDFLFKRSNTYGLRANEIEGASNNFYVLSRDKKSTETILPEDLKKASIGAIIACRLKSSRLPQKAILKIGEISSVELCIKSTLAFNNVNMTILATSDLEEDSPLENYTYNPSVIFHQGHPEDVMKRVLDAVEKYKVDVFVRITADMPFVSDEILQILLKAHFNSGADYTRARKAAIGTNLEIINASALRKAKSFFPSADFSEYMTYYFTNNPTHFKLNEVDLPSELIRDYRLTLDYPEDLEVFNKIVVCLAEKNLPMTLRNIFDFLDTHPDVVAINKGMEVKYFTDKALIDKINAHTIIK